MIANIDDAIEKEYIREKIMIEKNGGNKDAVQFREQMLEKSKQDLLDFISRMHLEFFGREKALNEAVRKLRDSGEL